MNLAGLVLDFGAGSDLSYRGERLVEKLFAETVE